MKDIDLERIRIIPHREADAKTALIMEGLLNHVINTDPVYSLGKHHQMSETAALERSIMTGTFFMRTVVISKNEYEALYPQISREFIRPEYWYRDPWDSRDDQIFCDMNTNRGNRTLISMAVRWAWGIE